MRALIVGGNRFVGYWLTWKLLARGHQVTHFNRGTLTDPFATRIERVHGDRGTPVFTHFLAANAHRFDAIVDFAAFKQSDVEPVVAAMRQHRPDCHYVFVSTGQVYLVRREISWPATESSYDGPLMERPNDEKGQSEWDYGANKRAAEDILFAAKDIRFTTLRIPMVNGPGDYYRRLEGYLVRMLDGGPILMPGGGDHLVRHVYGPDVAQTIVHLLERAEVTNKAFNLSQIEQPTLQAMLELAAGILGAPLITQSIPRATLETVGIPATAVSPYSGTWMSRLDPTVATQRLAFAPTPLERYLERTIESYLAAPPAMPPPNYTQYRSKELELAS